MLNKNKKNGYTMVETMISISIFLVVVMVGMNSLLNANMLHRKSQDMRSAIDTLSFIMEEMSRNLRVGYNYRCVSEYQIPDETPRSCPDGDMAIVFESSTGEVGNFNDQWVYAFVGTDILKSINGGGQAVALNRGLSEDDMTIEIDGGQSGFFVTGAEPPMGDLDQPFVTIKLAGLITYKNISTPFFLQTSVSQRLVDNVIQ